MKELNADPSNVTTSKSVSDGDMDLTSSATIEQDGTHEIDAVSEETLTSTNSPSGDYIEDDKLCM